MKKEISKNLVIVNIELNNFKLDNIGEEVPVSYTVVFKFHGEEILAIFTVEKINKFLSCNEYLDSSYCETKSDLLDSFECKLEDQNVADTICSECQKYWRDYNGNIGRYNYLGNKI